MIGKRNLLNRIILKDIKKFESNQNINMKKMKANIIKLKIRKFKIIQNLKILNWL